MPTGTGAIFTRNLPTTKFAINPGYFNALTSKTIFNPGNFNLPTFGNYIENQLLQVGIVSKLQLAVVGTITTTGAGLGATPIVPSAKWPGGLLDRVTLSGNGQNDFIACDGWDLKIRQRVQNRAMTDGWSNFPNDPLLAPFNLATAAYPFRLQYEVPVAMDDTTLIGSLYAQSEATNLTFRVAVASQADLFAVTAGTTIAIAAVVNLEQTIFEVPYDPEHKDTLIIPDLSVLHGLIANNSAIGAQTTADTQLYRIQGQLERLFWRQQDAVGSTVFYPAASYTQAALIYGSNQTPYTFQPLDHLRIRNMRDARQVLPDGIFVIDAIAENASRDQILLEGVTNLRLHTTYPVAPAATASLHFVQETLFA
jgi:hypothetical protein